MTGGSERVVQVINTIESSDGGPAYHAYDLCRALRSVGVDSTLVSISRLSDTSVYADDAAAEANLMSLRGDGRASLRSLAAEFRGADGVIVHGYYLWWVPLAVAYARARGIKVLLAPHGSLNDYQRKRSRGKKLVWRIAVGWWTDRLVGQFCVTSEHEASQVRRGGRKRVAVVGAGVAPAATAPPPPTRELRALSLSRIAPKKRIDLMLDAIAELVARGERASLDVAGTGEPAFVAELEARAVGLGIGGSVRFRGELVADQKEAAFRDATVFLAPSDDENFGIAVAEAMVRGVPVVASVHVDSALHVQSSLVLVVENRDARALADAMISAAALGTSSQARKQLAADAQEAFSWSVVAERWKALLSPPGRAQDGK